MFRHGRLKSFEGVMWSNDLSYCSDIQSTVLPEMPPVHILFLNVDLTLQISQDLYLINILFHFLLIFHIEEVVEKS